MIRLLEGVVSPPSIVTGALSWINALISRAPWIVAGIAIAAFLVERQVVVVRTTERNAAVAEVVEFRRLATDATVPPAADGTRPLLSAGDAKAALAAAFRDRDDARASLTRVDREAKAARVRADAGDATLARTQAANARAFDRAAPVIARLEAARPTGSAFVDAIAIDDDSKAAWEAWR